ncbi:PREDICTED: kinesin-like protein KIF23 [Papilio polytes]|uniref:kinesin-like protein KIF23 n=1 Tax=Papilio polytes TaxID=76194 RepID=UPI0006767A55|nr:PREDICTED: kinesin-like protein KIF23 [Papilio polytes]
MRSAKSKQRLNELRTPARSKQNLAPNERDPVQVYCRLRPMSRESDHSCIKIVSSNTVLLTPPATAISYRNENNKVMKYTFKEVFPPETSQAEVFDKVALPLVEGLIRGKSGLLFTYGVTGSGKTFTMTGEPQNCGLLPRCLNIIFKTINDFQAHKYIFKPDKMNLFDIQSEAEAMLERQQELHKFKSGKKNNSNPDLAMSSTDITKLEGVNEDNQYAVFVSYVEIYNNSVFDLLEEGPPLTKNLPAKIIREDAAHNMYVNGVTEIEIKSAEEAFEAFYLGLKRKRMAHTNLNAESSRSHSVFTIRLVQAPVDEMGEAVIQNKDVLKVSQLSLVDLAGSERTNRTKNTGQRLKEAGNINKSLMTLRSCLELLRENQLFGAKNKVPYRESKITHLFKNFFEGEGQVRMIVCANPRAEDYDETLQVMRFAEMAAEVEVAKPQIIDIAAEIGLKSGRRKANRLFNTAREYIMRPDAKELELDLGLVYSLGPDFPSLKISSSQEDHIIKELKAHLEMRLNRREILKRSKAVKDERLRSALLDLEKDSLEVRSENVSLRGQLAAAERRVRALEERLTATENASLSHQRKLNEMTEYTSSLKRELQEKDLLLSQNKLDKEKQKKILEKRYNHKIAAEHEKAKEICCESERLRNVIEDKENRLRIIAEALKIEREDHMEPVPKMMGDVGAQTSARDFTPGSTPRALPAHMLTPFSSAQQTKDTQSSRRGVAVANPRHKRSLSADGRGWIEHAPKNIVPMGTVLKPSIGHSKHVNKLTNVKDIANSKVSKYCLVTQAQDTDGEFEMTMYKGDVVPTCGGGAQVIFNDVEMLKQFSPTRQSNSARLSGNTCARHSGKRRETGGCSPPQTPSNTSKKQRVDDDEIIHMI